MKLAISITLCSTVFIGMAAWTWNICPDPLVDFGREVYIPWRLTQGEHLYRDIAHFNGPLSQYFNAVVFKVAGASLTTIKLINLIIAAGVLAMLFAIAKTLCDEVAAVSAGVFFCTFFAFNQTTGNANFNWLTPYSHELTHGIALALAMLCCLWRAGAESRGRWLVFAGFLMGLILLTKAEVIVASFVAAMAILVQPSLGRRTNIQRIAIFGITMIVPVAIAFAALSVSCGVPIAARGMLGSFGYLNNGALLNMTYFRWIGGGADRKMLVEGLAWLVLYVVVIGAVWMLIRGRTFSAKLTVILSILSAAIAYLITQQLWQSRMLERIAFMRPLPLILLAMLVLALIKQKPSIERALLIFAGMLLIKIRYNVQPSHYGFALAIPAMMVVLILAQRAMRASLSANACIARAMLIGILAQPAWVFLRLDNRAFDPRAPNARTIRLGEGNNEFIADPARGVAIHQLLHDINHLTGPDQTLAVLPEGLMINFLTQRKLSVPDTQWTPPAIAMFGEQPMLESLEKNPPDWIVLAHADTSIYDARWFGIDYARHIREWVDADYEVKRLYGATPFTSENFGALLLKRRANP